MSLLVRHLVQAVARGTIAFLGGYVACNLVLGRLSGDLDAGGFALGPWHGGVVARFAVAITLFAWGVAPALFAGRRRWVVTVAGLFFCVWTASDAIGAVRAFREGVEPRFGVPLSVGFLLCGVGAVLASARNGTQRTWREHRAALLVFLASFASFPALQFIGYGMTDYSRPAQAVVVFGARTYADGSLSQALTDRVRTASRLVTDGYAPLLVCSGGPGDGDVHEVEAMRDFAISLGVPPDAIRLDRGGVSTEATVRNTAELFEREGIDTILGVSHDFHLPRIRMAYQRAGIERVATVPARVEYVLNQTPYLWVRETAAFWVYWARGAGHPSRA